MKKDLEVVICHYQEDLKWVKELKHKYVIYNKNPVFYGRYDFDLPNIGFDAAVYLKYIVDNYDSLPDYVCFAQDQPFDHCPKALEKINNFNFDKPFVPIGAVYIRDQDQIVQSMITFANRLDIEYTLPVKFISSAQCIVSKELILKTPLSKYKQIKEYFEKVNRIITNDNYNFEYLWPTILNFNQELELNTTDCL